MDKSQTPPGRDGSRDEDAWKEGGKATPVKAKDFAKKAEKELNKAMDKNKARKMYELAEQLSKVDTTKLNEQQLADRSAMIKRLGEELKAMKEAPMAAPGMPGQDPDVPADHSQDQGHEQHSLGSMNVKKLGDALGIDPRPLRAALLRGERGQMTRTDVLTLSSAFMNLINADDRQVQLIANIIKAGNAATAQEGVINQPPKKMDVPAYKRKTQGGDWKVSTQDLEQDKLRNISSSEWLKKQREDEKIKEEAATRVNKVFDFSDYKG